MHVENLLFGPKKMKTQGPSEFFVQRVYRLQSANKLGAFLLQKFCYIRSMYIFGA
jgi:hypothetical protein